MAAGEVMTVLGPVQPGELGLTSMHEHILCDLRCYRAVERAALAHHDGVDVSFELSNRGLVCDEGFFLSSENCQLNDNAAMTEEVRAFGRAGGRSMLELSCGGIRTDIGGIREIAQRTNVNVVVSTGFYIRPSWPSDAAAMDEGGLEALMVDEIERGIGDAGIRAGHIGEMGITDLDDRDRRMLRAAARAAARTGLAVTIHPGWDASCDGRAILPILTDAGLAAERVILAHADAFLVEHDLRRLVLEPRSWQLETDYHEELLYAGANLSFDCFGHAWKIRARHWMIETDVHRLAGVASLVARGYADQIVLGTDLCFKMLTRGGGGHGYAYLPGWVLPTLNDLGVSERDIHKLTVENPARLLTQVSV